MCCLYVYVLLVCIAHLYCLYEVPCLVVLSPFSLYVLLICVAYMCCLYVLLKCIYMGCLYKVPGLVVLSPSKARFATHVGKFNVQELGYTLDAVLSGRSKTGPYSSLGALSKRACTEVHAEVAAALGGSGEEGEEDDIMKEMMEEIKAKEAAAKLEEVPPTRNPKPET